MYNKSETFSKYATNDFKIPPKRRRLRPSERKEAMESEFRQAIGKSAGEVMRDVSEFLATPCTLQNTKQACPLDLRALPNGLNMAEQFTFALLSEAELQGWTPEAAESFCRNACAGVVKEETVRSMIEAFSDKHSDAYYRFRKQYSNRFYMTDGSYWSCCLALAIDTGEISTVLRYLRLFIVALMEFAYMGENNPTVTYAWSYYESFRRILDELTADPDPNPLPLKIRALGGTAGERDGEAYALSLGIDVENPNELYMAFDLWIDVTLKDRDGNVIDVIGDRIDAIDPASIYHYGITKRIRGAAVASISAVVKAKSHLKLSLPLMNHTKLRSVRLLGERDGTALSGVLESQYDRPLRSLTIHYQLLSDDNRILGGGSVWCAEGLPTDAPLPFTSKLGLSLSGATKVVYSVSFNATELVED